MDINYNDQNINLLLDRIFRVDYEQFNNLNYKIFNNYLDRKLSVLKNNRTNYLKSLFNNQIEEFSKTKSKNTFWGLLDDLIEDCGDEKLIDKYLHFKQLNEENKSLKQNISWELISILFEEIELKYLKEDTKNKNKLDKMNKILSYYNYSYQIEEPGKTYFNALIHLKNIDVISSEPRNYIVEYLQLAIIDELGNVIRKAKVNVSLGK